jgi:hypothetical protein
MTVEDEIAPDKPRMTRKFRWEAVDSGLMRRMLEAAYEAEGRPDEAALISGLDRDSLIRQATRALGRPLRRRHMRSLAPVLRDRWLPKLTKSELHGLATVVQLSLSGPDRTANLTTKKEILDFLQRRNLTETFLVNLHTVFVSGRAWRYWEAERRRAHPA